MMMNGSLKIRQLIFNEDGIICTIYRPTDSECFHCPVSDIFSQDHLLAEFSLPDIRLICYFAVLNEIELDHQFLKKMKRE